MDLVRDAEERGLIDQANGAGERKRKELEESLGWGDSA